MLATSWLERIRASGEAVMTNDNTKPGLGAKFAGTIREVVAEVTGDAALQEKGRREIAGGDGRERQPQIESQNGRTPEKPS